MHHLAIDNPAPLFLVVLMLTIIVLDRRRSLSVHRLESWSCVCGGISALVFVLLNLLDVFRVGMMWHDEANIFSIAAAYSSGEPMYHAVTEPAFYSLFYGPCTFLIYAPLLSFSSHPLFAIRVAVCAVNLIELMLLYVVLRAYLLRSEALAVLPLATAFLLAFPLVLFGSRGDTWLLLCLTLAAVCALRLRPSLWLAAAVITGILCGLAVDFKATIAPVACIVLAMLYRRFGLRASVVFATTCVLAMVGIFALPRISLHNYLVWLVVSSHQRFLRSTCLSNLVAAAMLLAPVIQIVLLGTKPMRFDRTTKWMAAIGGFAVLICVVTGSKDGAGGWHLWPVMPFLLAGAAYQISLQRSNQGEAEESAHAGNESKLYQTSRHIPIVLCSVAIAGTAVSLYFGIRDFRIARPLGQREFYASEQSAQQTLASIIARSPSHGHLSMGYGSTVTDYRTDLRFELPLSRQDYFFDENSVVEGIKAAFPIPANVVQRILGCQDMWLIPHGQVPFSALRSGIVPATTTPYIFPDALRLHFTDDHVLSVKGDVYDLWTCP